MTRGSPSSSAMSSRSRRSIWRSASRAVCGGGAIRPPISVSGEQEAFDAAAGDGDADRGHGQQEGDVTEHRDAE